MAEFQLSIKNFIEATESTDCVVAAKLYGRITASTPSLRVPNQAIPSGATSLSISRTNDRVEVLFAPLHGEAPHTLRVRCSIAGANVEVGLEHPDGWLAAPKPYSVAMVAPGTYSLSLDNNWDAELSVNRPSWHWVVEVLDKNNTLVPLDQVLFADLDAQPGVWVSKPLRLSSLLLEVAQVEFFHPEWGVQTGSPWSLPGWHDEPGLPTGWSVQYAFGSGSNVGYEWRETLASREEILRNGWDSIRLRVTTAANTDGLTALSEARVTYAEEYATTRPSVPAKNFSSSLYEPRLRVLLDDVYDLTPFVASLERGSLRLVVPDSRFDKVLYATPFLRATLDDNPALFARVVSVRKEEFATGVAYTLGLTSLTDLLADKLDYDVIQADFDGDGSPDLLFTDDAGYIAFVSQNSPGVRVRPWLFETTGFRPVEAWLQNTDKKLVRLDSDYDWYQLYATTNKNLRGKLKDVANANLFDFVSVAGHPALVPMVPQAGVPLEQVQATVYNVTPNGLYLPEARLFVPEYVYDTAGVPRSLSVQGLPTTEDGLDSSVPVAVYHNSDSGAKKDFVVEAAWEGFEVDFQFTDAQGNAAVYVPGSLEIAYRDLHTIDLNPFYNPEARVTFITEGLKLPDGSVVNEVNGYRGVLGVRIAVSSYAAWTTFTFRFNGKLLYSASGERGEDSKKRAEGRYLPQWFRGAVAEMNSLAARLPKDEEVVENPFVTDYWLDNPALSGGVQTEPSGERYYELAGYRLYERQASRLADALALKRMLGLLTIELRYVGHPGLKVGDFVGIARRPEGGVGRPVEAVDYFLVLEDFAVSVQAGGRVVTSMRCGYVGTRLGSSNVRDVGGLRWQTPKSPLEEVFFF